MGLCLFAATLLCADTTATGPARLLYDTGIRQTAEGNFQAARATLQSLVDAYPKDPLAFEARGAIDAMQLFDEGQARAKAGKYETARVAFETLIAVYPENPLAARAKSALESLAGKAKARRPVVKAVEFRDVRAVPVEEIRAAMETREVRLTVGRPCRSKDIEQARAALEEILAEKGVANARVEAQTRAIRPHQVDIIFTVERPRGSLLLAPWRLAMAGWHRVRPASDPPDTNE
jgi:outer membrane protein assembly factor BamD (BamD/ComL family)